jgi:thiamine biosynthesis protein ThiI
MMMKRGCRILPAYVGLETFLGDDARARAEGVVEVLRRYQPDIRLRVIPDSYLACARDQLVREGLEKFTCLICKRRMYRIAGAVAREVGAKGIVTGESLGQVASQTLDNLMVLDDAAELPVYRPLIGLDKEEITRIARDIGTFKPSTGTVEGCRAVPRKPSTSASLDRIQEIEGNLKCDAAFPIKEPSEPRK